MVLQSRDLHMPELMLQSKIFRKITETNAQMFILLYATFPTVLLKQNRRVFP